MPFALTSWSIKEMISRPAMAGLEIKRDGKGVPLPLQFQDMEKLQGIQGFVPVIINIVPVTSLPFLAELQQQSQPPQAMAKAS